MNPLESLVNITPKISCISGSVAIGSKIAGEIFKDTPETALTCKAVEQMAISISIFTSGFDLGVVLYSRSSQFSRYFSSPSSVSFNRLDRLLGYGLVFSEIASQFLVK